MSLPIDYLKTFITLSETKGFTRTGIQLNKAQPAVSMQIKRLEEEVEKKLFERIGRVVMLTGEGRVFLKQAMRIVKEHEKAVRALSKPDLEGSIKLVKAVAENTGYEYDLVSLAGKKIHGCIGCMGCADDNICKVEDDFTPLREKIVDADAYILGGCNYFSTLNGSMHCFLERWYQFRHQEKSELWGKPAVTVAVGGMQTKQVANVLEQFCMYNFIQVVDRTGGLGAPGCYYCGYGETCKVGAVYAVHGEGFKITEENTPCVSKDAVCMERAREAGETLGKVLKGGHDREKATQEVRAAMMAMMGSDSGGEAL